MFSRVTSIPAWRKTLRAGMTSWFGSSKSPPHKHMKLQLVSTVLELFLYKDFGLQ